MKLLIENLFWIIIIIFGSIYLIFLEIENYNNKKYLKYKIKFTEEYIVEMKIINKLILDTNSFKLFKYIILHSWHCSTSFEKDIYIKINGNTI